MADNVRQMPRHRTIESIRKGVPAARLDQMAKALEIERPLLLSLVGISERTLQRKVRVASRLSPAVSDRLARLDRIVVLATEVFGSKDKAVVWLKRPSRALGAESPLWLLDTDAGAQHVERELRQIQYGFVS